MEKTIENNSQFENIQPHIVAVTGGTSGIGRAVVEHFCRRGDIVYIIARSTEKGVSLAKSLQNEGLRAKYISCDVRQEPQVKAAFLDIFKENGGLDIAINCAGALDSKKSIELEESEFNRVIDTNLKGTWLSMKYQIPEMQKKGKGSIVNISSIFGYLGSPGNSAYVASKHGVLGLTKTLALEHLKDNIRINAVAPSFARTPMVEKLFLNNLDKEKKILSALPKGEMILLKDIVNTVYWLCSSDSESIIGQCITIDNGITISSGV